MLLIPSRLILCVSDRQDSIQHYIAILISIRSGPLSSVGIATDYGLDGPGSNPGGDEIFLSSRPALGSNQSPVQWAPGLSRGQRRPGRGADPPTPI